MHSACGRSVCGHFCVIDKLKNNHKQFKTMNNKQLRGEYLAPKVKVVEMHARQQMLVGSPYDGVKNDGYTNDDYNWNE